MNDFAVFILTHGRPNKVLTYKSLQKHGYTGKIFIIIDNTDDKEKEYKRLYGDKVVVFDKEKIAKTFDSGDNFKDKRTIVYARNACFEIAKDLGIKYFMQFDDDYTLFYYKFNSRLEYGDWAIKNLNELFKIILDYYKTTTAKSIAISQGGDFIGGKHSSFAKEIRLKRKCMNTFLCSTERPFQFIGRINEDVNTYTQGKGNLFITLPNAFINQLQTQSNEGGMTDVYLDSGTYIKSFYSVMFSPSCVKINLMGKHRRLHHVVKWNNAVPVIISEEHRK